MAVGAGCDRYSALAPADATCVVLADTVWGAAAVPTMEGAGVCAGITSIVLDPAALDFGVSFSGFTFSF